MGRVEGGENFVRGDGAVWRAGTCTKINRSNSKGTKGSAKNALRGGYVNRHDVLVVIKDGRALEIHVQCL